MIRSLILFCLLVLSIVINVFLIRKDTHTNKYYKKVDDYLSAAEYYSFSLNRERDILIYLLQLQGIREPGFSDPSELLYYFEYLIDFQYLEKRRVYNKVLSILSEEPFTESIESFLKLRIFEIDYADSIMGIYTLTTSPVSNILVRKIFKIIPTDTINFLIPDPVVPNANFQIINKHEFLIDSLQLASITDVIYKNEIYDMRPVSIHEPDVGIRTKNKYVLELVYPIENFDGNILPLYVIAQRAIKGHNSNKIEGLLELLKSYCAPPPLARVCNACLIHKYVFTPILVIHFVFF